ncbi:MAG TPA: hypothetical protein VF168_13135 [Trueperaceae bacterium]
MRVTWALLTALLATKATAHEKWFVESAEYQAHLSRAFGPPAIWYVAGALLLVLLAYALWRFRGRRGILPGPELFGATPGGRSRLYGLAPMILGVHVAVPLLAAGVSGTLFASSVPLEGGWRFLLGLMQTGIALSFFYGGLTRPAAVALALLWLLGTVVTSPVAMLENIHMLGFAAFFFLTGRGPYAIDRLIFPRLEPPAHLARHAVAALRIGAGLSFIVVAFTEKLANLPLALSFLNEYPLNFTAELGIPMSDLSFILSAGMVELIIGLLLILGVFVRATIVVAWLPFNLTLTVFNWIELVGHLPFYGIMALLLVWDPHDRDGWVEGLRLPEATPPQAGRPPEHTVQGYRAGKPGRTD